MSVIPHCSRCSSNRFLSVIDELPVITCQVLHAAPLPGARALGLESSVCGPIEVGKAADLMLLHND